MSDTWQETLNPAPIRVPFGPGETDEIPLQIATDMLRLLHESNPYLFGQLFLKAYRLPTSARGKNNGQQP